MSSDRIEMKTLIRAPLARVWRALADSRDFGTWFGMRSDGPFVPGKLATRRKSQPIINMTGSFRPSDLVLATKVYRASGAVVVMKSRFAARIVHD